MIQLSVFLLFGTNFNYAESSNFHMNSYCYSSFTKPWQCALFQVFLRGSQERKDLALNPKRVSLVVGKDQQRTCAVVRPKCRGKPVVPRLPGQTFHWSKSADLWVCVSLSFPGAPRKKKVEKCALPRFCEIAVDPELSL